MDDLAKTESLRRFAEEVDAIALQGATPDCATLMQAFHAAFEAECAGLRQADSAPISEAKRKAQTVLR